MELIIAIQQCKKRMKFADRVKARRKELGLSVDEIAKKIGKNKATIHRYENGDIENIPVNVLEPLAKALMTTPAYLMGWKEEPEKESKEVKSILSTVESVLKEYLSDTLTKTLMERIRSTSDNMYYRKL